MDQRIAVSPPKLSQELTPEQYRELKRLIPHGVRRILFSALIDDLITVLKQPDGTMLIAAILKRQIGVKEIMNVGDKG